LESGATRSPLCSDWQSDCASGSGVGIAQQITASLAAAFSFDCLVLGGVPSAKLKGKIPGIRFRHNRTVFRGGMHLWKIEQVPTLMPAADHPIEVKPSPEWRVL
jgi:hypothetical protein